MPDRPTYVSMHTKPQVTTRMTEQFAKDLNLLIACQDKKDATAAIRSAVHMMADYYRHCMARQRGAQQAPYEEEEA